MFSTLKAAGNIHINVTQVLHTPVGSFYYEVVLEGFAANADYLGQTNEESDHFDQNFYRICRLENADAYFVIPQSQESFNEQYDPSIILYGPHDLFWSLMVLFCPPWTL